MPRISELVRLLSADSAKGFPPARILSNFLDNLNRDDECRFEGTPQDARNFVTWLKNNLKATGKEDAYTKKQIAALKNIEKNLRGDLRRRAFRQVDPGKFIFQLGFRVVKPECISQAGAYLCGTTALVIQMARNDPDDYADLAGGLFKDGRGKRGSLVIKADPILQFARTVRYLPECDYVVLTSVRHSAGIADPYQLSLGNLSNTETCAWLRHVGYWRVQNHTLGRDFYNNPELALYYPEGVTPIRVLRRMVQMFKEGFKILMREDTEIGWFARNKAPMSGGWRLDRHLVYVDNVDADQTHIRKLCMYTWCGRYMVDIDLDLFLRHFLGFIAFKM